MPPATPRFVLSALASLVITASGALAQQPVISSHVPSMIQSGRAVLVAPVDTRERMQLAMNLPITHQDQLNVLLAQLYNPASPMYHKWLSQPEFEARFGPTEKDKKALVQWAQDKGLEITSVSSNGRIVEVKGLVDTINRAFHVEERTYHDNLLNRDFHAPDREPTTDLSFPLLSVDGLENSQPIVNHLMRDPALSLPSSISAPRGSELLSSMSSGAVRNGGSAAHPNLYGSGPNGTYLPSDMRTAYYGNGNLTGAGQTVGIFSFDGYLTSDIAVYYNQTGFSSTVPVTNVLTGTYNGACTGGTNNSCDDGEQILDIMQVQGMAPGLTGILFYENGTTANTELNQMATDNKAKTITCSWGGGGFGTASDTYYMQMATQGQSFLTASGDDGAFNRNTYSAPSLDPYITQVGGTDLDTSSSNGPWASEISWAYSSGGYWITGISTSGKYAIPSWQTAAVNSTNKASATYRNVPDIAAEANFDNPTVINGSLALGYGGTSYAAPRMAGYIALANQQSLENGGTTLGFLNPALYSAGLSSSTASYYHDITVGTNPSTAGTAVSYSAVAGYDLVTGWGSPNGTGLLNVLAGNPLPDFALAPIPVTVQRSSTVTVTVPVTSYNGFEDTVSLAVSGLPSGVTATVTSGKPRNPPTITLTADSTPVMSTYNVTITGTGSNGTSTLVRTATLPVTVAKRAGADFSLSATAPSVMQTTTGGSTITVTSNAALSGGVSLSVSNLPLGVTASLSSNSTPDGATSTNVVLSLTVPGSTTSGTYAVLVTGTSVSGIVHTVTVPLTITIPTSLLLNSGFETGAASPWTFVNTTIQGLASGFVPYRGDYFAFLNGTAAASNATMAQSVSIPSGYSTATLSFWAAIYTNETVTTATDTLTVQLVDASGNVLTTLGTISNLNSTDYYNYYSYDVSAYLGQTVTVKFTGVQSGTVYTSFTLDDVLLFVK
jgi:hypothetical protein